MDLNAAILLEIRVMRAELAEVREESAHLTRRLLKRDDWRTGEALLPLAYELVGESVFTGPMLWMATLNPQTPTCQAVRELIGDFGTDEGGLRSFGWFLARLEGVPLAGHRLVKARGRNEGLGWRIALRRSSHCLI
jgi:hypothetical protein